LEKNNRKKQILIGLSLLGAVLIVVVIFALWLNSAISSKPSIKPTTKNFTIQVGEGAGDIAQRLEEENLITNSFAFVFYLNLKQVGNKLQAGEYVLKENLTMPEVAEILTKGQIQTNKITIPEGWDLEKIALSLETKGFVKKDAFLAQARVENYRGKYPFLGTLPEESTLEGFLYPDTYQLSKSADANEIITKMLDNFGKKIKPYESDISKSKFTLYEIVNLAAVVEREVAKADDRKLVASVFLNRLNINMALESCATIQYILDDNKKQFTYEETRTPSPYNTYINRGLPRGPIGNPSIESIAAVVRPVESSYLYFLSSEGITYFSKTLDEHNVKKAKYLD
jgi:UPF0755 protein